MGKIHVVIPKSAAPYLFLGRADKRKILEDTAKRKCPEWAKAHRAKVRKLGKIHFKATLTAIAGVLKRGGGPTATTRVDSSESAPVSHRVKFKDASGKSRFITTVPWEPLTEKYARKKPRSVSFWHKWGLAERMILARVGRAHITVRQGVGGGRVKAGKNKVTCRSVARIGAQRMPFPLSKVITDSFVSGTEVNFQMPGSLKGINRKGPMRFMFPESYRPFIAALSARMGRYFHTALRKLP